MSCLAVAHASLKVERLTAMKGGGDERSVVVEAVHRIELMAAHVHITDSLWWEWAESGTKEEMV